MSLWWMKQVSARGGRYFCNIIIDRRSFIKMLRSLRSLIAPYLIHFYLTQLIDDYKSLRSS